MANRNMTYVGRCSTCKQVVAIHVANGTPEQTAEFKAEWQRQGLITELLAHDKAVDSLLENDCKCDY